MPKNISRRQGCRCGENLKMCPQAQKYPGTCWSLSSRWGEKQCWWRHVETLTYSPLLFSGGEDGSRRSMITSPALCPWTSSRMSGPATKVPGLSNSPDRWICHDAPMKSSTGCWGIGGSGTLAKSGFSVQRALDWKMSLARVTTALAWKFLFSVVCLLACLFACWSFLLYKLYKL